MKNHRFLHSESPASLSLMHDEGLRQSNQIEIPLVLIIDSNEKHRHALKEKLKKYYRVREADNGQDGWQKTLSCHPCLVITDINAPVIDGFEFCKKARADRRTSHIPVILLMSVVNDNDQIKSLKVGAYDCLSKLSNFEILNAKINSILTLNQYLKDIYSKKISVVSEPIEIKSTDERLISNIVKYIEDNIDDSDLSIEHLSRHIGMCRGSLYRKIVFLTGLTPIEYLRSIKLDKAVILLEKSNYNVNQIASMIGFGTPNYFAKVFRDRYHMTPTQFIVLNRKSNIKRFESHLV